MEDFDEIPVDAQFFNVLGGTSFQIPPPEADPLSIPSVPPPPPPKPRVTLPPPPRPTLPVSVRPSPGIPPQYRSMPITVFAQEMERNLHDIIYESIYLFQRDPLTYHPFYLRLYKYITIGQHLGYVSVDPSSVISIWQGFSSFADAQFQKMRNGLEEDSLNFTGERSPYANYLLTGKVIIEGKEVLQKRNKEERDKLMKKLEEKGNLLKIQWKIKNGRTLGGGGGLRGDLGVRLKFFEECKAVTFPGDVEEMNKVWSGFLGVVEGKTTSSPPKILRTTPNILRRRTPAKLQKIAPRPPIPSKTVLSEEEAVIKTEAEEDDQKKKVKLEEQESRHALRRIMIKVIVVPPSSSSTKGASTEGAVAALSPPPSPPSSPPSSPAPCSPPPSPSPEEESPPTAVAPSSSKATSKISSSKVKRKLRKVKRGGVSRIKKISFGNAILRKKKKKIFKKVVASSKTPLKTVMLERQLKLEKLINKPKLKLPSGKNVIKMRRKRLEGKLSSTAKASSDLIGRQLKLEKLIGKKSKLAEGKGGNLKGRKIVGKGKPKTEKVAPKKVEKVKVVEKKRPVRKVTARNGRRKRKMSSESEDEEEEEIKVPLRRSARQPKLKYKNYGNDHDDDDDN